MWAGTQATTLTLALFYLLTQRTVALYCNRLEGFSVPKAAFGITACRGGRGCPWAIPALRASLWEPAAPPTPLKLIIHFWCLEEQSEAGNSGLALTHWLCARGCYQHLGVGNGVLCFIFSFPSRC